ncbi:MAG: 2-polyprenylphenol 6-hydroxylase, partial [Loktanella sp.]|nr:2-polyprenylphenol 6-hydroxylase [Loktanella sp.]
LSYLFEVTERFGMETRTELIHLQRTMVVVEGVARSLDPRMNIWEVAKPVVEDYIKQSIGPKALLRDLSRTAMILARFGPQLPRLAEQALIRLNNPPPEPKPQRRVARLSWMALGGVLVGGAMWLGQMM